MEDRRFSLKFFLILYGTFLNFLSSCFSFLRKKLVRSLVISQNIFGTFARHNSALSGNYWEMFSDINSLEVT